MFALDERMNSGYYCNVKVRGGGLVSVGEQKCNMYYSNMKLSAETVNGFEQLTISEKSFILDVCP